MKMKTGLRWPLAALSLACMSAWAQERNEVEQLGAISVTASGFAQEVVSAPASITVIPREELEGKRFESLADALRQVPGVSVLGGDKGAISIRGMESEHVLVLIDGRRQDMRQITMKGGVSEALDMNWIPPLEAIERIEVVRGPMSTLYGSEALGGVINIVTRKVADKWHGSLTGGYTLQDSGSAGNSGSADLYLSGPLVPGRLGLQFWGYHKQRQEDQVLNGFARAKRQNGTVRLWATPNDNHEFMFEAGRTTQHFWTTPGKSLALTGKANENEYVRDSYTLAHTGRWGSFDTELSLNREQAYRDGPTQTARPDIRNTVIDGKLTLPLADHMLVGGFQWRKSELQADGYYANPNGAGVDTSVREYSLFLEDEWSLSPSFALTGGVRMDDNEFYGRHWTPRLYGVWSATDAWTLKGGIAKGFKSPTIMQSNPQIGLPQRGGAYTWGNPDLEPEVSTNVELGLYFDDGGPLSANATLFHTRYKNKIANTGSRQLYYPDGRPVPPDPYTNSMYSTYFNITEARVQGLELGLAYRFNEQWKVRGSYTFTDSKVRNGSATILGFGYPQSEGQPLVATPRNMGSLTLDWTPNEAVSAFSTLSVRGRETNISWGQGGAVSESMGTIATVDLGASWRARKDLSLSAAVYNLTDRRRDSGTSGAYSYAEDGRRFWLQAEYRF
ncbi:TonB-dependent receptor domain-containing protein [Alcaligenes faecalis]|uniref:TonB-dependent receptor domain-containing protein n=1 Tax=Alcaligenes faecalis TaxID=511 RepID=UPI001C9B51C7|nr:TonB-dependent receptor [Alcaligenes faecalis]MBY6309541.1 TonB-dependent receptor [Alcaligenes faecalis]MBY6318338.1 TonB-dependent receptor [Alcaligenes faecalis]MBY6392420.1 TonB-dependent receptor [Alcaligenes faecalis]